MDKINDVDVFGVADPTRYQAPQMLDIKVYAPLKSLSDHGQTDMLDVEAVLYDIRACQIIQTRCDEADKWLSNNVQLYLNAMNFDQGFEVKLYRIALEHSDNTSCVMQETQDRQSAINYTDQLKKEWKERGFILRAREDKAVNVMRMVKSPTTDKLEERFYCTLRLSAISPRNRTPADAQRFPTPEMIRAERELNSPVKKG